MDKSIYAIGKKFRVLYWNFFIYRFFRKKYFIPASFKFNGDGINIYGEGRLLIGENTYIGSRSAINVEAHSCVSIGVSCQISHNVRIYTKTAIADQDFSVKPVQTRQGDVSIGDYCWVGFNVFIGPGVRVGNNCVIGANSVVTRDIPDFEIWGGVPAKFIRRKRI